MVNGFLRNAAIHINGYSETVGKMLIVGESNTGPTGGQFSEGKKTAGMTTGNNDDSIDLAQGVTNQIVKNVRISSSSSNADIQIIFYDGAAPTLPSGLSLQLGFICIIQCGTHGFD